MESDGSWKMESNDYAAQAKRTHVSVTYKARKYERADDFGSWGNNGNPFASFPDFPVPWTDPHCVYTLLEREQRREQEIVREISSYSRITLVEHCRSTNVTQSSLRSLN